MTMQCESCGYEFPAKLGRYGCPNCEGEPLAPTPTEIKATRKTAGITQAKAGALLHTTVRTWQQWEAGDRAMHPAFWELFCIKVERKPLTTNQLDRQILGDADDKRAAFEKHFNLSARQAWKTKDGNDYMNQEIQAKWEGWQAAQSNV